MINGNKFLEYFQGKCIFITGCTGSVGMALLEKFLRSFPQIQKIILLVRSKKTSNATSRILHYFENPIFSVMKEMNKDYLKKIMWVEGDVIKPNLGLGEEDLSYIQNNVNIFYHCAAAVKLADTLKNSIQNNLHGTEMVYNVAKGCRNIQCFMYVSTIFSNHRVTPTELKEEIYKNPINPDLLLEMVNSLNNDELQERCKESKDWLCSYVFSKNAAENLIDNKRDNIKKGILRIGCVMETYQEPIPSWLINENALNVLLKNATTGIVFKCHPNSSLYCVPIDLCINALIASTYDTAHIQENLKVYNLGTNHPKLSEIFKWYISENVKNPWLIFGSLKYRFLCHMKDLVLEMSGKRGIYVKEMEVLERFIEITREFAYKELYCHSENLDVLWNGLNQSERELLCFNLKEIDFEKYVKGWFKLNKDNLLNPLDSKSTLLYLSKL